MKFKDMFGDSLYVNRFDEISHTFEFLDVRRVVITRDSLTDCIKHNTRYVSHGVVFDCSSPEQMYITYGCKIMALDSEATSQLLEYLSR